VLLSFDLKKIKQPKWAILPEVASIMQNNHNNNIFCQKIT